MTPETRAARTLRQAATALEQHRPEDAALAALEATWWARVAGRDRAAPLATLLRAMTQGAERFPGQERLRRVTIDDIDRLEGAGAEADRLEIELESTNGTLDGHLLRAGWDKSWPARTLEIPDPAPRRRLLRALVRRLLQRREHQPTSVGYLLAAGDLSDTTLDPLQRAFAFATGHAEDLESAHHWLDAMQVNTSAKARLRSDRAMLLGAAREDICYRAEILDTEDIATHVPVYLQRAAARPALRDQNHALAASRLYDLRRFEECAEVLSRIPDDGEPYARLIKLNLTAALLRDQGHLQDALQMFREVRGIAALGRLPNTWAAAVGNEGTVLVELGRPDDALHCHHAVHEVNQTQWDSYRNARILVGHLLPISSGERVRSDTDPPKRIAGSALLQTSLYRRPWHEHGAAFATVYGQTLSPAVRETWRRWVDETASPVHQRRFMIRCAQVEPIEALSAEALDATVKLCHAEPVVRERLLLLDWCRRAFEHLGRQDQADALLDTTLALSRDLLRDVEAGAAAFFLPVRFGPLWYHAAERALLTGRPTQATGLLQEARSLGGETPTPAPSGMTLEVFCGTDAVWGRLDGAAPESAFRRLLEVEALEAWLARWQAELQQLRAGRGPDDRAPEGARALLEELARRLLPEAWQDAMLAEGRLRIQATGAVRRVPWALLPLDRCVGRCLLHVARLRWGAPPPPGPADGPDHAGSAVIRVLPPDQLRRHPLPSRAPALDHVVETPEIEAAALLGALRTCGRVAVVAHGAIGPLGLPTLHLEPTRPGWRRGPGAVLDPTDLVGLDLGLAGKRVVIAACEGGSVREFGGLPSASPMAFPEALVARGAHHVVAWDGLLPIREATDVALRLIADPHDAPVDVLRATIAERAGDRKSLLLGSVQVHGAG
ncbi:MAG: hypothetical protein H6739_19600 [Alphaproteobacteria bacterium]|nr:hypothetical protein [Alphaproteobacteria bacterium]